MSSVRIERGHAQDCEATHNASHKYEWQKTGNVQYGRSMLALERATLHGEGANLLLPHCIHPEGTE